MFVADSVRRAPGGRVAVPAGPVRTGLAAVRASLLLLGLVAALLLSGVGPAFAGDSFVEVTPNTAQPGTRVSIRASCDEANNRQATVHSEAFGRVVVRPDNGFLTGAVTIPDNRSPGSFEVRLDCPNGATATTTINVVNMSKPTQGPATGGGGTAGGSRGPLALAAGLTIVVLGTGLWLFGPRRGRTGTGR